MTKPDKALHKVLVCPRTREPLEYVSLDTEAGFLCPATGVLYPVIDGIIIMAPITDDVKKLCLAFFKRQSGALTILGGQFSINETFKALSLVTLAETIDWSSEEMRYWEQRFEKQLKDSDWGRTGWNRTLPRQKLLERLPEEVHRKVILEIGCGGASTLYDVYGETIEKYIGLDLSFNACRLAKRLFPKGLIIQASAESLPLKTESVDLIVAYGVLHHLPHHEQQLTVFLPILKPGGFFIGSDPVLKPRIPRPRLLRKESVSTGAYSSDRHLETGMSPHNEWIDWDNLLAIIKDRAQLVDALFEYSPLRHVLVSLLNNRLGIHSKAVAKLLIDLDRMWLATVGKLSRKLGPGGVIYTLKRTGR
ncbi:MAG: hypothetical protein A2X59_08140 [Nitrospirae bacterium GWC2_42_7]|nr:MAG: hypothetical protein A2X59_08140 [Nitrospirae bacterium GWC2_42_7]